MSDDADTPALNRDPALFRMRRILDTPEHRARLAPATVARFQTLIDRYAGDACHTLSDTERGHLREAERALGILSNRYTAVTPRRRAAQNRAALGHDLPDDRKDELPPWLMGERPPTFPEWLKVRGYVLSLMSFLRAVTRKTGVIDMGLHVYTDSEEFVIAESPEDADAVMRDLKYDGPAMEWVRMSDNGPFTVDLDNGDGPVKRTCAEWCAVRGRGYFCALRD